MMLIRSISLSNFKKFTAPIRVSGLQPGVTVIAGDNEDGKSTIVAALKAAFCAKYSSIASAKDFQPYGSAVVPQVDVEFDFKGNTYVLKKSFGKKGTAEFRRPDGTFVGSEAEEKVSELCLIGGEKKDTSIWNVLWVEQGTAFNSPNVTDLAQRTLHGALEGEIGKIVGGDDGQRLLKRAKELFDKWFTPGGKDKTGANANEAVAAETKLNEITEEYAKCLDQHQQYDQLLRDYEQVKQAISKYESDKIIEAAEKALAELEKVTAAAAAKKQIFETLKQTESAKQAEFKTVQAAWSARRTLKVEEEELQKKIADSTKRLDELKILLESASKNLHALQQASTDSEQAVEAAEKLAKSADLAYQAAQLHEQVLLRRQNYSKAQKAKLEAEVLHKKGQSIKIDQKSLQELRAMEQSLAVTEAKLTALGTKIEFKPVPPNAVLHKGVDLVCNEPFVVTEQTEFELSNWGALVIKPGAGDLEQLRKQAADARQKFQEKLEACGATSVAEAEKLERERAEAAMEFQALAKEITRLAPATIAALGEELARDESRLKEWLGIDDLTGANVGEPEAKRKERDVASVNASEAKKLFQETANKAKRAGDEFHKLNTEMQTCTALEKNVAEQLVICRSKLTTERERESDEALDQRLTMAKVEAEAATAERAKVESELSELNYATLDAEFKKAEQNLKDKRSEFQRLELSKVELGGKLQGLGGSGVGENLARLEGKKEQAAKQATRARRKADAIKLLYNTLVECEKSSKHELIQPLMGHLAPYVQEVFDNGSLVLDQANFEIKQLRRNNQDEKYETLSLGTREQLSVLTRLAFAQVLSDNGQPSVVILDDALVYADHGRFDKMKRVLEKAGEKFQVLILTCRERDYEDMQANLIRITDCAAAPVSM